MSFRGHAIEARITAEDPLNRFLPASGAWRRCATPPGRVCGWIARSTTAWTIPLYYDSLLAKLICWGEDRAEAMARLRRALDEYVIAGVRTTSRSPAGCSTIPFRGRRLLDRFHRRDMGSPTRRCRQLAADGGRRGDIPLEEIAALAAALAAQDEGEAAASRKHPAASRRVAMAAAGARWVVARRSGADGKSQLSRPSVTFTFCPNIVGETGARRELAAAFRPK